MLATSVENKKLDLFLFDETSEMVELTKVRW